MMTKRQALVFRERLSNGERPSLPEVVSGYLCCCEAADLRHMIDHARAFHYGTVVKTYCRRLIQMGLLNEDLTPTELGRSYRDRFFGCTA